MNGNHSPQIETAKEELHALTGYVETDAIHAFERVWIELIEQIGGEAWKLTDPALEELRVKKFPGLLASRDQLRRA